MIGEGRGDGEGWIGPLSGGYEVELETKYSNFSIYGSIIVLLNSLDLIFPHSISQTLYKNPALKPNLIKLNHQLTHNFY